MYQTITTTDGEKVQLSTKAERMTISAMHQDHNWKIAGWILNQRYVSVIGRIGYSGSKTHRFVATTYTVNGRTVLHGAYPVCGSRKFGSGTAIVTNDNGRSEVTCLKCQPKQTPKTKKEERS